DLTGGLGIDSYFLSEKFKTSYYVENQKELCNLADHNFAVLGRKITVVNSDAETFLNQNLKFDLVFIDPARRDVYNRKMVSLHDCTPDVVNFVGTWRAASVQTVMIKLSPMLDISMIINELPNIAEIHIVAVKNECKEVLVLLRPDNDGEITIHCVDLFPVGTRHTLSLQYAINDESVAIPTFATTIKKYLYEPNAAIMKAGAFKLVSQRFGIDKLHINSHLYTSDNLIPDFPGRVFEVVGFAPFSKKIKKELLKDVTEASVVVRNFPLSANELRKSLNLKESDENFVFGTIMMGEKKVVIYCKKHRE
ncbi:MAG: SAM-dependent methyltransferase, partial [Bacteroidales bacterium]|nr:SAM-dependent methyltransferase [Bacteroidales bacterium]